MTPVTSQACWPASRWISDDGHIPGRRITKCVFLNNLTGTGRINYIHSTYVAHQTENRCFDSSSPLKIPFREETHKQLVVDAVNGNRLPRQPDAGRPVGGGAGVEAGEDHRGRLQRAVHVGAERVHLQTHPGDQEGRVRLLGQIFIKKRT